MSLVLIDPGPECIYIEKSFFHGKREIERDGGEVGRGRTSNQRYPRKRERKREGGAIPSVN